MKPCRVALASSSPLRVEGRNRGGGARLGLACLVFLMGSTLGIGALVERVEIHQEAADTPDQERSFVLPRVAAGTRVVWEHVRVDLRAEDVPTESMEYIQTHVLWQLPLHMLDSAGHLRLLQPVGMATVAQNGTGFDILDSRTEYLDYETGELVAVSVHAHRTSEALVGLDIFGFDAEEINLEFSRPGSLLVPTCGASPYLGGRTVGLASPLLWDSCEYLGRRVDLKGTIAVDVTQECGSTCLVLAKGSEGEMAGGRTFLWIPFDPPVPVRALFERADAPGVFDGLRLARSSLILAPAAPLAPTLQGPAPDIRPEPRHPSGPSALRSSLPFSAREAYEWWLNDSPDPYLREFVSNHSDAYVLAADYFLQTQLSLGGWTTPYKDVWRLAIAGGTDMISVEAQQNRPDETNPESWLDQAKGSKPSIIGKRDYWERWLLSTGEGIPPSSAMPSHVPSMEELALRWSSFRPLPMPFYESEWWGFRFRCDGPDCSSANLTLWSSFSKWADELPESRKMLFLVMGYSSIDGEATFSADGGVQRLKDRLVIHSAVVDSAKAALETQVEGAAAPVQREPSTTTDAGTSMGIGTEWRLPAWPLFGAIGPGALLLALLVGFWSTIRGALESVTTYVVGYSRTSLATVQNHPIRARIAVLVSEVPGIHLNALQRRLGLPRGQVQHHVEKLLWAGLLVERKQLGYRCFFARKAASAAALASAGALQAVGARRVLDLVVRQPGLSARSISAAVSLSLPTTRHHLKRLEKGGLVRIEKTILRWQVHPVVADATASASP